MGQNAFLKHGTVHHVHVNMMGSYSQILIFKHQEEKWCDGLCHDQAAYGAWLKVAISVQNPAHILIVTKSIIPAEVFVTSAFY